MARRRVRYDPDIAGLGRIMTSSVMQAMLRGRAELGKAHAEAEAPVDTGRYAGSFRVTGSNRSSIGRSDRAEARLENTSGHAKIVEFQVKRVLGHTVDVIERG